MALDATQEAVDTDRALAKDHPDAFLPDLAMSLNNLGKMLSDLGRREPALDATQEAVDTYRALAKDRPDAFLPDLATSLNNLGNRLGDLGRREQALDAEELGKRILDQLKAAGYNHPDSGVYPNPNPDFNTLSGIPPMRSTSRISLAGSKLWWVMS